MYYTVQDEKQRVLSLVETSDGDPTESILSRLKLIWSADFIKVDCTTAGYDQAVTNYSLRVIDSKTTYSTTVAVKQFATL